MSLPQARVGSVAAPPDPKRAWRTAWIAAGLGSGAWMISVNPFVGGLFVATGVFTVAMRRDRKRRWAKRWSEDMTALAKGLHGGDLDAAEQILTRRYRISTNRVGTGILDYYRGELCWARGDLDGALGGFRDCTRYLKRSMRGVSELYWRSKFYVASLQLELGQLEDAERSCALAFEAPRSPALDLFHVGLETLHARVHDRPDELGDAAQLAGRAQVARAHAQGLTLATLSWAYERRGDRETAASLRDEARAILEPSRDFWRARYPRSSAWFAREVGVER